MELTSNAPSANWKLPSCDGRLMEAGSLLAEGEAELHSSQLSRAAFHRRA